MKLDRLNSEREVDRCIRSHGWAIVRRHGIDDRRRAQMVPADWAEITRRNDLVVLHAQVCSCTSGIFYRVAVKVRSPGDPEGTPASSSATSYE